AVSSQLSSGGECSGNPAGVIPTGPAFQAEGGISPRIDLAGKPLPAGDPQSTRLSPSLPHGRRSAPWQKRGRQGRHPSQEAGLSKESLLPSPTYSIFRLFYHDAGGGEFRANGVGLREVARGASASHVGDLFLDICVRQRARLNGVDQFGADFLFPTFILCP